MDGGLVNMVRLFIIVILIQMSERLNAAIYFCY